MFRLIFEKYIALLLSFFVFLFLFAYDFTYEIHRFIYAFSFFNLIWFLRALDRRLAIPELLSFVCTFGYCTVPAMLFDLNVQEDMPEKMFGYEILAVEPYSYYVFALGSSVLFFLLVVLPFRHMRSKKAIQRWKIQFLERYDLNKVLILFAIIILFSSLLKGTFAPLDYVFYLGSQLIAPMLILAMFAETKKKEFIIVSLVLILMFFNIVKTGMFGSMFFSLLFYFLIRTLVKGLNPKAKVLLPVVGLIGLTFLQVFKMSYRAQAWTNTDGNNLTIFFNVLSATFNQPNGELTRQGRLMILTRTNQAYLTSRTLEHVPKSKDYAKGETLIAVVSSFVPRIFWPNKPALSGSALMEEYGNYDPYGDTSMSIGQLGESYVNFGKIGGGIFFGFYGLIIASLIGFVFKLSIKGKPYILFIPLIFYHMIKVEVIFSKAFNTAFKSILFAVLVIYLIELYCRKKLAAKNEKEEVGI